VAGIVVYGGAKNYREKRNLSGLFLIASGYFIFVFIVFSILNNRGVA
jgi:hypothetical protein